MRRWKLAEIENTEPKIGYDLGMALVVVEEGGLGNLGNVVVDMKKSKKIQRIVAENGNNETNVWSSILQ